MYKQLSHWSTDYKHLTDRLEEYSQKRNALKCKLNDLIKNGSINPLYKHINILRMLEIQIKEINKYIEKNRPPFGSYCIVCTQLYDEATYNDMRKYELIGFCGDLCYNMFSNSIK